MPELDEMCKSSEDNSAAESDEHESLVDEMEQLLDEVDQAAADDQDSADPAAGQVSGEACSDIKSVIQKMKSTKVVIIPDVSLEPDRSPIGEPEEDDDVVIVEEIKKPRIKISSFARIVPISDDDDVTVIERPKQDLSSNYEHVDMDLSCENDAEIQFFKDQIDPEKQKDAPFPPSVWQILSQARPRPPPPPRRQPPLLRPGSGESLKRVGSCRPAKLTRRRRKSRERAPTSRTKKTWIR